MRSGKAEARQYHSNKCSGPTSAIRPAPRLVGLVAAMSCVCALSEPRSVRSNSLLPRCAARFRPFLRLAICAPRRFGQPCRRRSADLGPPTWSRAKLFRVPGDGTVAHRPNPGLPFSGAPRLAPAAAISRAARFQIEKFALAGPAPRASAMRLKLKSAGNPTRRSTPAGSPTVNVCRPAAPGRWLPPWWRPARSMATRRGRATSARQWPGAAVTVRSRRLPVTLPGGY